MSMTMTTPALLFPAISLLLLAYTNRFLVLAQLIRQLNTREGGQVRDLGKTANRESTAADVFNTIDAALGSHQFCTLYLVDVFSVYAMGLSGPNSFWRQPRQSDAELTGVFV